MLTLPCPLALVASRGVMGPGPPSQRRPRSHISSPSEAGASLPRPRALGGSLAPWLRVAMSPAARSVCLFPHELLSQRGHPAWGMGGAHRAEDGSVARL